MSKIKQNESPIRQVLTRIGLKDDDELNTSVEVLVKNLKDYRPEDALPILLGSVHFLLEIAPPEARERMKKKIAETAKNEWKIILTN